MAGYTARPKPLGRFEKNPKRKDMDENRATALQRRLQKLNGNSSDKKKKEDPNAKRVEKRKSFGY